MKGKSLKEKGEIFEEYMMGKLGLEAQFQFLKKRLITTTRENYLNGVGKFVNFLNERAFGERFTYNTEKAVVNGVI
jgi:hypothetical protein